MALTLSMLSEEPRKRSGAKEGETTSLHLPMYGTNTDAIGGSEPSSPWHVGSELSMVTDNRRGSLANMSKTANEGASYS